MLFSTKVSGVTTKDSQHDTASKVSCLEMLDRDYNTPVWTHVYTDGSSDAAVRNGGSGIHTRFSNGKTRSRSLAVGALSSNYRAELTALHEAARLLRQRRHPRPTLSSLQTANLLSKAYSHPESSWKETYNAFFVTCHTTGRSLSSSSMLTVGSQETRRRIVLASQAVSKSSPTWTSLM